MSTRFGAAIAAVTFSMCVSTALAATIRVPAHFDTIQEAVDNAEPGDTIALSRGTYTENVTFDDKDGLRFIGKGKPTWDGAPMGTHGSQVRATGSDDLLFQGILFRNGSTQIDVDGDGLTVNKCVSRGSELRFVGVVGDRAVIQGCRVSGSGSDPIDVDGDDCLIQKNRFQYCGEGAIDLNGNGAVVQRNTMRTMEDGPGIEITGNDARVLKNKMSNIGGDGVELDGDDGLIQGNQMRGSDGTGIDVSGDRVTVDKNKLYDLGDSGMDVDGRDFVITRNLVSGQHDDGIGYDISADDGFGGRVENNKAVDIMEDGFDISMDGGSVIGNSATYIGSEDDAAFSISGTNIMVSGNTAAFCQQHGFDIDGTGHTLTANNAKECDRDGFNVEGTGHTLDRCTSIGAGAEGLDNGGTMTTVRNSRFLKSRIDVANEGTFANDIDASGNRFDTGGTTTAPQID